MQGQDAEIYVSTGEASRFLGVCPTTIKNMVLDGRLRGFRDVSRWRVSPTSIREFLAKRANEATTGE